MIASKRTGWKIAKHLAQWSATLETYAYPVIGSRDVSAIDTAAVLDVLNPVWTTKHETATRLRQRIEAVLTAAKVRELRSGENPAAWRGHLAALLPTISKKTRVRHHPAMRWQDLPRFMAELRRRDSMSARALELTILTACRTSGVLGAIWGEFDLDAANWTIPPERMKGRVKHRVALSDAAVAMLRALPRHDAADWVFWTLREGEPRRLSNMAMLELLRGMHPARSACVAPSPAMPTNLAACGCVGGGKVATDPPPPLEAEPPPPPQAARLKPPKITAPKA